jgi:hypothetical protein
MKIHEKSFPWQVNIAGRLQSAGRLDEVVLPQRIIQGDSIVPHRSLEWGCFPEDEPLKVSMAR